MPFRTAASAAVVALAVLANPIRAFVSKPSLAARSASETSLGVFGRRASSPSPSSSAATSPAADDAVELFRAKYASRRKVRPIIESDLRSTFAEMVRLFGEESATRMVRSVPQTLEMERSYFAQTYGIFCDKFGKDETDALLLRNPALLSIKPDGWGPEGYAGAESAGPETVALSYVVAATRPLGEYGVWAVVGLLSVPAVEAVTGIPIRESILPPDVYALLPGR